MLRTIVRFIGVVLVWSLIVAIAMGIVSLARRVFIGSEGRPGLAHGLKQKAQEKAASASVKIAMAKAKREERKAAKRDAHLEHDDVEVIEASA